MQPLTDILKGQSAFRLYKPLTKNLENLEPISTEEYDKENEHKEAQVTKEQWYSKPDGVKLLQEIYQTFPQKDIKDLSMSRDTVTEDISLSLTAQNLPMTVYFPAFFPKENPKVLLDNQKDWREIQLQYEKTMQPDEVANLLLTCLHNFVINEEKKRQQRNQSNRKNNKKNQNQPMANRRRKGHQKQGQAPLTSENTTKPKHEPTARQEASPVDENDQHEQSTRQTQTLPTVDHGHDDQGEPPEESQLPEEQNVQTPRTRTSRTRTSTNK